MFKTLFSEGYPFSYDLDEFAQYYTDYRAQLLAAGIDAAEVEC